MISWFQAIVKTICFKTNVVFLFYSYMITTVYLKVWKIRGCEFCSSNITSCVKPFFLTLRFDNSAPANTFYVLFHKNSLQRGVGDLILYCGRRLYQYSEDDFRFWSNLNHAFKRMIYTLKKKLSGSGWTSGWDLA